jgi:hypothetical protein
MRLLHVWRWFLQTAPATPPNQGMADTLDEAKTAFKKRYEQVAQKRVGRPEGHPLIAAARWLSLTNSPISAAQLLSCRLALVTREWPVSPSS